MRGRKSIVESWLSYDEIRNCKITDEDKIYLSEVVEYTFRKLSFYNQKMYNDYINPDIPLKDLKNIYGKLVELKIHLIKKTIGEILVKIGILSYIYDCKISIYKLNNYRGIDYKQKVNEISENDILLNRNVSDNFLSKIVWKNHIYTVSDLRDLNLLELDKLREIGKKHSKLLKEEIEYIFLT